MMSWIVDPSGESVVEDFDTVSQVNPYDYDTTSAVRRGSVGPGVEADYDSEWGGT